MLNLFGNPSQQQQIIYLLRTAGIADIALQGYQAYQNGQLNEFVNRQYQNNFMFRLFYDGSKDKSLREILQGFGINLDNNADSVVK